MLALGRLQQLGEQRTSRGGFEWTVNFWLRTLGKRQVRQRGMHPQLSETPAGRNAQSLWGMWSHVKPKLSKVREPIPPCAVIFGPLTGLGTIRCVLLLLKMYWGCLLRLRQPTTPHKPICCKLLLLCYGGACENNLRGKKSARAMDIHECECTFPCCSDAGDIGYRFRGEAVPRVRLQRAGRDSSLPKSALYLLYCSAIFSQYLVASYR